VTLVAVVVATLWVMRKQQIDVRELSLHAAKMAA
jgi:hypothetical protein